MKVIRKCDSSKQGEKYKCNSQEGGMKCIKNECQLMERCDGYRRGMGR